MTKKKAPQQDSEELIPSFDAAGNGSIKFYDADWNCVFDSSTSDLTPEEFLEQHLNPNESVWLREENS